MMIYVAKLHFNEKGEKGMEPCQQVSQKKLLKSEVVLGELWPDCSQVEPSIQCLFACLPDVNYPHFQAVFLTFVDTTQK